MRMQLLEAWNGYRLRVIPPDASDVQLKESRRAFYMASPEDMTAHINGLVYQKLTQALEELVNL